MLTICWVNSPPLHSPNLLQASGTKREKKLLGAPDPCSTISSIRAENNREAWEEEESFHSRDTKTAEMSPMRRAVSPPARHSRGLRWGDGCRQQTGSKQKGNAEANVVPGAPQGSSLLCEFRSSGDDSKLHSMVGPKCDCEKVMKDPCDLMIKCQVKISISKCRLIQKGEEKKKSLSCTGRRRAAYLAVRKETKTPQITAQSQQLTASGGQKNKQNIGSGCDTTGKCTAVLVPLPRGQRDGRGDEKHFVPIEMR